MFQNEEAEKKDLKERDQNSQQYSHLTKNKLVFLAPERTSNYSSKNICDPAT